MTNESRSDMIHRWSMTDDLQEFVTLGKELHPEATEEFFKQVFKDSYKTGSPSKTDEADEERPTWDDFFSATERQEKIAILEKMFGSGVLTPEEVERFLAID